MSRFTSRGAVAEIGASLDLTVPQRPETMADNARDLGSAAVVLAFKLATVYWIYRLVTKEKK